MTDKKAFLKEPRRAPERRPVDERLRDNRAVYKDVSDDRAQQQAGRCMDCGVPFCQAGCPLGNIIPDWNTLTRQGNWREAWERLRATNNFPEFTGRICPAPCESACVLGLVADPVTIEQVEQAVIEHAFRAGWVQPEPPATRTDYAVAVVGSGPAGLACAQQLNRAGHAVTVFERDDRLGGLLRYGIPDFKLEKWVIDRRLEILEEEGIRFVCGVEVGVDVTPEALRADFDAVVLCTGATAPRDLDLPGRELDGIHFAWEYLWRHSKAVAGDNIDVDHIPDIDAQGKHVIVIGGGDTASDCIGIANRQGAASVTNFHHWPAPPSARPAHQPWPFHPDTLTVSSSHEEGCDRVWAVETVAFEGTGRIERVRTVDVEPQTGPDGRRVKATVPGSTQHWPADLVILAIGYEGPDTRGLGALGVEQDGRGRIRTGDDYATDAPDVFAAGDNRRGASLVVWAISEGREAARAVDRHLTGTTALPTKGEGDLPRA